MPSLRDALKSADADISQRVSADAVEKLKGVSDTISQQLRERYNDFFQVMHDDVLNSPDISANLGKAMPRIFEKSGIRVARWRPITDRWFMEKERAVKAGDPKAINFYHGITDALIYKAGNFKRGRHRGRRKASLSFERFINSIASRKAEAVEDFFGPMKLAYSLSRPDKGKVQVVQVNDTIKIIRQWAGSGPKKGKFTRSLDGTVIKLTVTAFPKLTGIATEAALVAHMMAEDGNKAQWVKIAGSKGPAQIRMILLPLVNWYMQSEFERIIRKNFSFR